MRKRTLAERSEKGVALTIKTSGIWAIELAREREAYWQLVEEWDRAHSNDDDLLSNETEANRELLRQAGAAAEIDDLSSAFPLYLDAAKAGSALAMETVACRYWTGSGTAPDLDQAEIYYRRAADAGSQMAHIHCARLLFAQLRYEESERVLQHSAISNFAPAAFWLASHRYWRCKSRSVASEIRPLLEYAARAGHPGAKNFLKRLMATGKLGIFAIPKGLLLPVSYPVVSTKSDT